MPRLMSLVFAACAIAGSGIPTVGAQSNDRLAIGITDHEGFFIDGKSFNIVPGRTQKELSDLIGKLDAHSLGPGAIIFRMGNRLYIAEAPVAAERYGGSRNDYGSDRFGGSRNDYGSDRYGRDSGGTVADAERDFREWQDSLRGNARYGGSRNDYGSDRYGGSRNDYGSDRYGGSRNDYGTDRVYISDPDYVQFKLRQAFEENWGGPIEDK
jgi:hypothetical protein